MIPSEAAITAALPERSSRALMAGGLLGVALRRLRLRLRLLLLLLLLREPAQ